MLKLQDVTVIYPDKTKAISDLSFTLPKGGNIALIGENGAGKTSLLLAIVGILETAGGTIELNGIQLNKKTVNEIRKQPYAVVLFDEIEKAHPLILDKFLQILEDGRMTDGQGNTVYFSETIIIFTSNLGIYTKNEHGEREVNVTSEMPYQEVFTRIREAIENYFKLELGRPEILNRIGENIVVFDFIRPEVAHLILDSQINKIINNLMAEKRIAVNLSESAYTTLREHMLSNLGNGGRGIGNIVESLLINPLARYLFDNEIFNNAKITIDNIDAQNIPASLDCSRNDN